MLLWVSGVILLTFAVWYWFWRREQVFIFLREVVRELVRRYRLEYPDEKLRGFNITFKEKEEKGSGGEYTREVIATAILVLVALIIAMAVAYWLGQIMRGAV